MLSSLFIITYLQEEAKLSYYLNSSVMILFSEIEKPEFKHFVKRPII